MTKGVIHIHEDDWGLRNLYPLAAWQEASEDLSQASAAGRRNVVPDGTGWTDVHLIVRPKADFANAGLSLEAASGAVQSWLPRVHRFTATATAGFDSTSRDIYGSYETDAHAFGFDANCFVKLEPRGALVRQIWFEARTVDAGRLERLKAALLAIDALCNAVIVDYVLEAAGRVGDSLFLASYFHALAEQG